MTDSGGVAVRRPSWIIVLSMIAILVLPATTNIAANALPESWHSYLWLSWPASLLLAAPVVLAETRRQRSRRLPSSAPPMAQVRAWNIPLPLTSFTNRTSELVDIGTLMMRGHGRALVIYGMGGVGKTQLALTYAHRSRQTLSVGWLVPAASRAQAMASLSELARALGFIDTHQRATVAALLSYLNGRDGWLLIFDDGREVSDLIGLLPTSPGGRVLITSRDPQFDQLADALMLQPFPTGEATSFLLRRSGDVDAEEAGHIAAEMGGLPLALEQIGAYCRDTGISLQAYHNRLRTNRRRLLEVGAPAARMNVQLTVRLAVKRARRQFRPSHRLLRQLSVLASADVPRAMLESLRLSPIRPTSRFLVVDRSVSTLNRASLLTVSTSTRLRLHEVIAETVRAEFDRREELKLVMSALRMLDSYLPHEADSPTHWPKAVDALPHLEVLVATVERHGATLGRREAVLVAMLLNRGATYVFSRGDSRKAEGLCRQGLAVARRSLNDADLTVRTIMLNLAVILHRLGEFDEARTLDELVLTESLRDWGTDHLISAWAMNNLGGVLLELSTDLPRAQELIEQAVRVRERILGPDAVPTLVSRNNLGKALRHRGDFDGARAIGEEVLAVGLAQLGEEDPKVLVWSNNVAEVLRLQGDLDAAAALHRRILALRDRVLGPTHPMTIVSRNNLARVMFAKGDVGEARQLYQESVEAAAVTLPEGHPQAVEAQDGLLRSGNEPAADAP